MDTTKLQYKITKLPESKVEIQVTVDQTLFEEKRKSTLKEMSKNLSLKGFRKGQVPAALAEAHLGLDVVNKAINALIPDTADQILSKEELTPLDTVDYKEVKFGNQDDALEGEAKDETKEIDRNIYYTMVFTAIPDVVLPNYSEINVTKGSSEASDEEVSEFITKYTAEIDEARDEAKEKGETFDEEKNKVPSKEEAKEVIERNKAKNTQEKFIEDILNELISKSKFDFPASLIPAEVEAREKEFTTQVEQLGIGVQNYLEMQGKTMEDMKTIWAENFRKSMEMMIVLREIIKQEKIQVTSEELQKTLESMNPEERKHYNNMQSLQSLVGYMSQNKAIDFVVDKVSAR